MMTRLCHGSGSGKPEGTNIPDLRASVKEYIPNLNASAKQKSTKKKKAALRSLNGLDSSGKCLVTKSGGQPTAKQKPVDSCYSYEMFGHCHQTVDKYLEISGKSRDSLKQKQQHLVLTTTSSLAKNLRRGAFFLLQLLALFLRLCMLLASLVTTSCGAYIC